MVLKVRIVEDKVTWLVKRANDWLDVEGNIDWLLPRLLVAIFVAMVLAMLLV